MTDNKKDELFLFYNLHVLVSGIGIGGKKSIDNIHILKTIPYIEMSLQSIGDLKRVQ